MSLFTKSKKNNFILSSIYFDNILNLKARNLLSSIFGSISFILFTISALFKISTLNIGAGLASIVSLFLSLASYIYGIDFSNTEIIKVKLFPFFDSLNIYLFEGLHFWNGIMLFSFMFYVLIKLFGLMVRSSENSNIPFSRNNTNSNYSYPVAYIVSLMRNGDLIKSFCLSKYGKSILKRLCIDEEQIGVFIENRNDINKYSSSNILGGIQSLEDLARLISKDTYFRNWLDSHKIAIDDLVISSEIVQSQIDSTIIKNRYYGREALSKWVQLGRKLFLYTDDYIEKYADVPDSFSDNKSINQAPVYFNNVLNKILLGNTSNLYIYFDSSELLLFSEVISDSNLSSIKNDKRIISFDQKRFFNEVYSSESFIVELEGLLKQISNSSYTTFIIPDYSALSNFASDFDIDLESIIEPFLEDDNIQIVCISDYSQLSKLQIDKSYILDKFEQHNVSLKDFNLKIKIFLPIIFEIESEYNILFSVSAIKLLIENYNNLNNFDNNNLLIKTIFLNLADYAINNNLTIISEFDIDKYLSLNSYPSLYRFRNFSPNKLLELESFLRKDIICPQYILSKISNSINRIFSERTLKDKKPISFIFFGGENYLKIKLIKALSLFFYGKNNKFIHLKMNDYSDSRGLSKLVGTLTGARGVFIEALRELNSGIIILDDISYAHASVQNYFADIIKNGYVYNSIGDCFDCSSYMFIATSSLGEMEISLYTNINSQNYYSYNNSILDNIKKSSSIKNSLFDAFDEKVLFAPPDESDFYKIVKNALIDKSKDYSNDGIILVVNDFLIKKVLEYVVSLSFGSDQLYRIIEEIIEPIIKAKIAKNIGSHSSHIELFEQDFK